MEASKAIQATHSTEDKSSASQKVSSEAVDPKKPRHAPLMPAFIDMIKYLNEKVLFIIITQKYYLSLFVLHKNKNTIITSASQHSTCIIPSKKRQWEQNLCFTLKATSNGRILHFRIIQISISNQGLKLIRTVEYGHQSYSSKLFLK